MAQEENPPTVPAVERVEGGSSNEPTLNGSQEQFPSHLLRADFPSDAATMFTVTVFPDASARRKKELDLTPSGLRDLILSESAAEKESLRWIKLAKFGSQRSKHNSLRHDANVIAITGTEIDYDTERVSFDEAVARVRRAGVTAMLYTSPSHTEDNPRWRVLFPTSAPLAPGMRRKITEVANDIIGGVAAPESFVLSQSYFFGQVIGNEAVKVEMVTGDFIDSPLPAHDLIDNNPFTRAGEVFDLPLPIDVDARLSAMRPGGEGDGGINRTQLQVTASLLNQGVPIDEVVARVLEATQRVAPESWDWSHERHKITRLCTTWEAKRQAEAAKAQVISPSGAGTAALDRRDPMANARVMIKAQFTDERRRRVLHRYRAGFWQYAENCYREATDEDMQAKVWTFLEKSRARAKKGAQPFKPDKATVANVQEALMAASALDSSMDAPCWLVDQDQRTPAREFLACANGLLHLPTRTVHPATPEYFSVVATRVAFDPDATAPEWDQFLGQIFSGDGEAHDLLQEAFGYYLSPDTSQQKIFLMVGPRRSGKGTIGRVLREVLGKESVAGPTMSSLSEQFGLEPLITKSLAIISDARIGPKTNKTAITERLLSISGEDAMTVDRKHRPAWHGQLPTRFMILTNELPALSDGSGALAGRFMVLNLTRSFYGEEDHGLTNRLLTNASGILNWSLEGYRRLSQRGRFIQPASSRQSVEEIEMLASPVKAFISDRCAIRIGAAISLDELWAAYKMWIEDEYSSRDPGNKPWFSRNLRTALPQLTTRRPRVGGHERALEFVGIELRRDGTASMVQQP